jgi:DNA ligase-associated metallophosphoesterase
LQTLIEFAGTHFVPQPCGAMFWRNESMLIVSDLHFEKSSHFAMKGVFLPPYDSFETLTKLLETCRFLHPKTILFLGDVFHDSNGLQRLNHDTQSLFTHIYENYNILWIDGNHDRGSSPVGIPVYESYSLQNINFRHIAKQEDNEYEISGHYHPCISFYHKGHKVRRPCFIFNKHKLMMPAYGSLTGGLDCRVDPIKNIIQNPKIIALNGSGVVDITSFNTP